jgi:phage-related protein
VIDFQAVFYRDASGREPVRAFIDSLEDDSQAAIEHQIVRLNLLSDAIPHLPFPHSSQVEGELRELRCHYGRGLYRILYRRSERLVVLLHIFPSAPRRSARPTSVSRRSGGRTSRCAWTRRGVYRRVPPDTTRRRRPVISQFC